MRHRSVVLVVVLALSLAGCSGGLSGGTGTPSSDGRITETETPTDGTTPETTNSSNFSTADLQRAELELRTTTMGAPPSVVNGTAPSGAEQVRVNRTVTDNRTTREISMPENWTSRLVGNLEDGQVSEPDTDVVVSDYSQSFTLRLVFAETTAEIPVDTSTGFPDRIPVVVGDRTYYSDDPELRAVVSELYRSSSQALAQQPSTDR